MSASGGIAGPIGTPVGANQTVANAGAGATLNSVPGKTNYLCGFSVTGGGATAASLVAVQITGVVGGPFNYEIAIPAGATSPIAPLIVEFVTPLPATGPNTQIVVFVPAAGAGNTNLSVAAHGYVV